MLKGAVDPPESEHANRDFCPHLGRWNDLSTPFRCPTGRNACCHTGEPVPVDKATQARYCLTADFVRCPRVADSTPASGSLNPPPETRST